MARWVYLLGTADYVSVARAVVEALVFHALIQGRGWIIDELLPCKHRICFLLSTNLKFFPSSFICQKRSFKLPLNYLLEDKSLPWSGHVDWSWACFLIIIIIVTRESSVRLDIELYHYLMFFFLVDQRQWRLVAGFSKIVFRRFMDASRSTRRHSGLTRHLIIDFVWSTWVRRWDKRGLMI